VCVCVYEMHNENTLVDQMLVKTTKLPTQLRFITELKAIFAHRAAEYQKLARNVAHLQVPCCLANELHHVTLLQALYAQPTTKLRSILERKLDVLFEFPRSL